MTDAAGTSVVPMPRRNLVPLVLLAVLAVLVLVFALVGASSAPGSATIAVQNATGETFGAPPGTTSFSMSLVDSHRVSGGVLLHLADAADQLRAARPHGGVPGRHLREADRRTG